MAKVFQQNDPIRVELATYLKKESVEKKAPIWARVADDLLKANSRRAEINIDKINKYTKQGDFVVIAGKTLGDGSLDHKIIVASFKFSKSARDKIEKMKGEAISIEELVKRSPKGKGVKILR